MRKRLTGLKAACLLLQIMYNGQPITKMACGAEFSMLMDCKGNLYSFGCPEYGQLGMEGSFLKALQSGCKWRARRQRGAAHTRYKCN